MTYAYDATGFVDPYAAHAAGYVTAIRYLNGGKPTPTPTQLSAYRDAGVAVAFVYETDGRSAARGHAGGVDDVHVAESVALDVGLPADRPIFYAPWDDPVDAGRVEDDYWQAVAQTSVRQSFGAYGNAATLRRATYSPRCRYAWHVETWGRFGGAQLVLTQLANTPGPPIAGVDPSRYDANVVHAPDHGQWPFTPGPPAPAHRPGVTAMTVMWIDFKGINAYLVQAGVIVHQFNGEPSPDYGLPVDALDFANTTSCGIVHLSGPEWQSLLRRSGMLPPA